MTFDSLAEALDGMFEKPLRHLPKKLQKRVEQAFFPIKWDSLSAEQRYSVTLQWDYQNDPSTEQDREFWFHFYVRMDLVRKQIDEWEAIAAPTASDLAKKETRVKELKRGLARIENEERRLQARGDRRSGIVGAAGTTAANTGRESVQYIPYPKALEALSSRFDATPDELAAWVWLGPEYGGLTAYLHANELEDPQRFYFASLSDREGSEYLAPLMGCWFRSDEIAAFEPADRFVTGRALMERWGKLPGIDPAAFIRAKIAESRLLDIHPIFGATQAGSPEDAFLPSLESGLYMASHIEAIEAADFDTDTADQKSSRSEDGAEPSVGSREWLVRNARAAANARHDRPGGSRDKQRWIREAWASGDYRTRDQCAEVMQHQLGVSYSTARNALKGEPEPPGRR